MQARRVAAERKRMLLLREVEEVVGFLEADLVLERADLVQERGPLVAHARRLRDEYVAQLNAPAKQRRKQRTYRETAYRLADHPVPCRVVHGLSHKRPEPDAG